MGITFADSIPLISDAIAFIGNERTNSKNMQAVRETNATNMAIANANNEAAAALQEKNNIFNAEEAEKAYNRNRDLSLELLNENQVYNSAKEQMIRYAQAGINPNVAFSKSTAQGVMGSASSSAPSASSAPLPQFQAPSLTPPVVSNPFQQINIASDLANFMKSIAEAKKAGAETSSIEQQLDSTIQNIKSETELNNAKQRQIDYTTKVDKLNLDARQKAEIKERLQHIQLMTLQGKTEEAEKELKDAQKEYQNIQSKTARDSLPLILQGLREDNKLKVEMQNTERSKQSANYATAEEARTRSKLNREQLEIVKTQQGYWEDLAYSQHLDTMIKDANWYKEFKANETKLLREHVITEQMYTALEAAIQAKDWFLFSTLCNSIAQLGNAGANIYGASKAGKVTSVTEHTHYHGDSYIDSYHYDGR